MIVPVRVPSLLFAALGTAALVKAQDTIARKQVQYDESAPPSSWSPAAWSPSTAAAWSAASAATAVSSSAEVNAYAAYRSSASAEAAPWSQSQAQSQSQSHSTQQPSQTWVSGSLVDDWVVQSSSPAWEPSQSASGWSSGAPPTPTATSAPGAATPTTANFNNGMWTPGAGNNGLYVSSNWGNSLQPSASAASASRLSTVGFVSLTTDALGHTIALAIASGNATPHDSPNQDQVILSPGAIAGITIGGVAGLLLLIAGAWLIRRALHKRRVAAAEGGAFGGSSEKAMYGTYAPVGDMGETIALPGVMYEGGEGELYDAPAAAAAGGAAPAAAADKPSLFARSAGLFADARSKVTAAVHMGRTPVSQVESAAGGAAPVAPAAAGASGLSRAPTFRGGYVPSAALREGSVVSSNAAYEGY